MAKVLKEELGDRKVEVMVDGRSGDMVTKGYGGRMAMRFAAGE